jgi:hypothetical protein
MTRLTLASVTSDLNASNISLVKTTKGYIVTLANGYSSAQPTLVKVLSFVNDNHRLDSIPAPVDEANQPADVTVVSTTPSSNTSYHRVESIPENGKSIPTPVSNSTYNTSNAEAQAARITQLYEYASYRGLNALACLGDDSEHQLELLLLSKCGTRYRAPVQDHSSRLSKQLYKRGYRFRDNLSL